MNQASTADPAGGAASQPPLDEVMLAMDVVDTLRRRARLVKREFDTEVREQDLEDRLRQIYSAQGIAVPDHILKEGVAALAEGRFVYRPPTQGLGVRLARLYVSRGRWGKWVLGGLAAVIMAWLVSFFVFVLPDSRLPEELAELHAQTLRLARSDNARETAERLFGAGVSALQNDDAKGAREARTALERLGTQLRREYSLRILSEPGARSGVWRIPDVNSGARNYYLIVQAIDPTGKRLKLPVRNEETGKTEQVERWGLRVDQATFERVAKDKRDDGIIQRDRVGDKKPGYLIPTYEIDTAGGAITEW